jgi:hypothetical protein
MGAGVTLNAIADFPSVVERARTAHDGGQVMVEISVSALMIAIKAIDRDIKARKKALEDHLVPETHEEECTDYVFDQMEILSELCGIYDREARRADPKLPPLEKWLTAEYALLSLLKLRQANSYKDCRTRSADSSKHRSRIREGTRCFGPSIGSTSNDGEPATRATKRHHATRRAAGRGLR